MSAVLPVLVRCERQLTVIREARNRRRAEGSMMGSCRTKRVWCPTPQVLDAAEPHDCRPRIPSASVGSLARAEREVDRLF
jgi:hypothetical protein